MSDLVDELIQLRDSRKGTALELIIDEVIKMLSTRAGRLLVRGTHFIVIANDEIYYQAIYNLIREIEQIKGTWTDECEKQFQENCEVIGMDSAKSILDSIIDSILQIKSARGAIIGIKKNLNIPFSDEDFK